MQAPYIPAPDAAFNDWLTNFSTKLTAAPTDYGLVAGDATVVAAVVAIWTAAYALIIDPTTKTAPAVAAKDAARAAATATVRPYAQSISLNSGITDDLKVGIGVNLPNPSRPRIPAPITAPTLGHAFSIPNQATIAYGDASTPTSKAKPPGVAVMELRVQYGTALAADPDTAPLYGLVTKSPVQVATDPAQVGKIATMWGRWRTKSGPGGQSQFGPWSNAIGVIVV